MNAESELAEKGLKIYMISSHPTKGCGVSRYAGSLCRGLSGIPVQVASGRVSFLRDRKIIGPWLGFLHDILRNSPQVIHIQYTPSICGYTLPLFLILVKILRPHCKIVLTAHEKSSVYRRKQGAITKSLYFMYELIVFHLIDRILVHTEEHREEITARFRVPGPKTLVVPFGVDEPHVVSDEDIGRVAERYHLEPGTVILFLGALRPNKGLEYLLRAFSMIKKRMPDVTLVIAGEAAPGHAEYLLELKRMKEAAALGEDVRFIGFVEDVDIPALVSISSIVVLPYTGITQSGVLHWEAIPYGKPVIATDVGGIGETVRKHDLGTVIPPGDGDALAYAILDLLNDEDRMELCAANAQSLEGIYSWENVASRHAAIYLDLLEP